MGLLTDPAATKELSKKIEKYGEKLGWIGYFGGIIWLCLQSTGQFNAKTYIDENALLPGLADPQFTKEHSKLGSLVNSELDQCDNLNCQLQILERFSILTRAKYETMKWTTCQQSGMCFEGQNFIIQARGKWSNPVESIIVNVPLYGPMEKQNRAIGMSFGLIENIMSESHWGKEIIFVFTEHGRHGIKCWLEANFHSPQKCMISSFPEIIAHSPQTGIVLEAHSEFFDSIDIKMEGDLGQMTNQDVVNVAVKIAGRLSLPVTFMKKSGPANNEDISPLFFEQMLQIGTGEGTGNHANLIKHGIHAITLKTTTIRAKGRYHPLYYSRLAEGILRSQNNLLERLHASIWFYMFSSLHHYSSISLYMPVIGLVLVLPLGYGLKAWVTSSDLTSDEFSIQLDPLIKVMTVIIGFNYLASFLITGIARDYMFLIMNLCMVLPVVLPIVMNRARTDNSNPFHSKTEAAVLLLFSLQCGLVALLCFPQALYLSITAVFTIIASKYRKPWMIILSHPIIFFVADQSRCLFLETDECDWSISGYSDWINRIVTSEYSNVYTLLLFSALPIWSTLFYTSLTKKSSKTKTE